jgi:hypothetical protein
LTDQITGDKTTADKPEKHRSDVKVAKDKVAVKMKDKKDLSIGKTATKKPTENQQLPKGNKKLMKMGKAPIDRTSHRTTFSYTIHSLISRLVFKMTTLRQRERKLTRRGRGIFRLPRQRKN